MKKNTLTTLLDRGYSSFELCFTVKLRRTGLLKWLENKGILKEKTEGFAVIVQNIDNMHYISSGECNEFGLQGFKLNGIR